MAISYRNASRRKSSASAYSVGRLAYGQSAMGKQYTTDAEGNLIRVFAEGEITLDADVIEWLADKRVVTFEEGLEFCSEKVIKKMISRGHLRKGEAGMLWITKAGAAFYGLQAVNARPIKYPA